MSSSAPIADESGLLHLARSGDESAVERLYADHVGAARRLATALAGPEDADELVAEGFSRVLAQLAEGKGPTSNFRSYLYTTIRNHHRDRMRTRDRSVPASDMPWLLDETVASAEEVVESLSEDQAVRALQSLPERWRRILWQLEVEGLSVSEAARVHEMAPTAVSMLSFRAREGLRVAYLGQRVEADDVTGDCRWVRDRLVKYVRGSVSPRARAKIDAHLPTCLGCTAILDDLEETNRKFAALLLPVVLVGGVATLDGGAGGDGSDTEDAAAQTPATGGLVTSVWAGVRAAALAGRTALTIPVLTALAATLVVLVMVPLLLQDSGEAGPALPAPSTPSTTAPPASDSPVAEPTVPVPPAPTVRAVESRLLYSRPPTLARPTPVPATPVPPSDPPTTPPSVPPTTTPPPPVVVRPVRPTSVAIADCATYGSLTLPTTEGVRYQRVEGDGTQGRWVVVATARKGYRIADGARTRFSGELGSYYECAHWTEPPSVPWDVDTLKAVLTAPVTATGPGSYDVLIEATFSDTAHFVEDSFSAAGWDCRAPGGEPLVGYSLAPGDAATCRFTYDGSAVPKLELAFLSATQPAGSATLYSDGVGRETSSY